MYHKIYYIFLNFHNPHNTLYHNKNYILEISNIDFISAIFDEINLEENLKIEILNNIYLKNKHDLEKLLNKNVDCKYKKYILSFIELSGNYKDILKKLKNLKCQKSIPKILISKSQ